MKKLPRLLFVLLGLCLVALVIDRDRVEQLFGPKRVKLDETHVGDSGTATFDHRNLDGVLKKYVRPGGWVDYAGLEQSPDRLDAYISSLAQVDFEALARDEKLALAINAYNAFTLRLILDHLPLDSIQDIPEDKRWKARRWVLGGKTVSLQDLEDDWLRAGFRDPRIHFAINCASVSCPPLRMEAYRGADIEAQLRDQADFVHHNRRWFELDTQSDDLHLTRLYLWYEGDFEQIAGSSLEFAARYSTELRERLAANGAPDIGWIEYDWALNDLAAGAR